MQVVLFLLLLLLLIPLFRLFGAEVSDKLFVGFGYYGDNGKSHVFSPIVELVKKLSREWILTVKERIDAISAASIKNGGRVFQVDSVAGASPSKQGLFQDLRSATTLSLTWTDVDNTVSFGGYFSREIDYEGKSVFLTYIRQLNLQNTALGISLSQANDRWFPRFKREGCPKSRNERKIDLSITQLWSPTLMFSFIYSDIYSYGFLPSPYHYYITKDWARFESYPNKRKASAYTLRAVKLLNERTSLNLMYRYYTDDWKIKSHTINAEVYRDVKRNFTLGFRGRLYTQTKSFFAKSIGNYKLNDPYIAIDYRMSAFSSITLGTMFIYKPKKRSLRHLKFKGSFDLYFTSNNEYIKTWYGVSNLNAIFLTFGVDYNF